MMNVMVGFHFLKKGETATEMDQGGGTLKAELCRIERMQKKKKKSEYDFKKERTK